LVPKHILATYIPLRAANGKQTMKLCASLPPKPWAWHC